MGYFALCSFDLANASRTDYENAYSDLAKLGLHMQITGSDGTVRLPTTMAAGELDASDGPSLRDNLIESISAAFQARGFSYEIFVSVSAGSWAWGHRATS